MISGSRTLRPAAASIALAEMGDGITVALSYMVADQIRDGRLAPLLDNFTPPPVPVHLVYPQSRLVSAKLRAFIDFAAPRLHATLDGLSLPAPNANGHPAGRL
ncbi:LysR substrate-binding domain-containing protein [Methylocystis sp.]|uniref:LysR substrate-binding domain-containing protein n=1 Tax=Methylocystis sp. TaxID=1911079 RepID=UPI0027337E1F|nr:LysR substrate-binding domain-containing protein [Methylocystis sp.]MDP3554494.1 LysR substrate-binding domain-containing protein [Methylocystis sp.]